MSKKIKELSEAELDYACSPVPEDGRTSHFSLTMAWWSCCSAMFYVVVAATLAMGYGTVNTLIGIGLSVVTYAAINMVISRYAIRTGSSVSLFSRILFGRTGSALATLIFAATAIYYAVFEGSVIAMAANFFQPGLSYKTAALIVVVVSVPLVFGSVQHWLDKFNGVLLPVYLLGLATCVGLAINEYGYSNAWLTSVPQGGAPAMGWWHVYVAYMGVWILMMFCFDYARFGKKSDERYHALFNFGAPFYIAAFLLSGVAGIFLVNTIPIDGALSEVSAVKAIIIMMGGFGLLFVWVTQTRINTANYYLASVNLEALGKQAFGIKLSKYFWAVVVGCIVYVLMLVDVFSYLLQALAYQGVFVVAWVAIALAYMLNEADDEHPAEASKNDGDYPNYNSRGLIAWFGAVIVGIVMMNIPAVASFSSPCSAISGFALYRMLGFSEKTVPGAAMSIIGKGEIE
ncbi:MAG: allantoin permease [Desulfobulbaceae bacterium BRH_c16a]|nr:MAG: allantoin permease [Desulfobulbaceae bacterium BRH_c16a]